MQGRRLWALAPDDHAGLHYLRAAGCRVLSRPAADGMDRDRLRTDLRDCDAVLLMADAATNCRVAGLVRGMGLPLDLVAVMGHARPGEMTALLRVGVDWVMRQGDPPALLAAVLRTLRLRRQSAAGGLGGGPAHVIGPWALEDQAWCLRHAGGAALRLTVSERAILACLFESPGHVASHAMLMHALAQAWQPQEGRRPRDPKPRGIISRLRWRGLQTGMEPPIEALRGYGYVWEL